MSSKLTLHTNVISSLQCAHSNKYSVSVSVHTGLSKSTSDHSEKHGGISTEEITEIIHKTNKNQPIQWLNCRKANVFKEPIHSKISKAKTAYKFVAEMFNASGKPKRCLYSCDSQTIYTLPFSCQNQRPGTIKLSKLQPPPYWEHTAFIFSGK